MFLLSVFLFQLTLSFAQSNDWGPWQTTACFKGLQFRTRPMSANPNNFSKYIQFRNNYSKKVAFSFVVKEGSKETDEYIKENGGQYRTEMKANSTDDGLMWISLKNNNTPYLAIGYLRQLGNDETDASHPFQTCDEKNSLGVCLLCKLHPKFGCGNYDKTKESKPIQKEENNSTNSLSVVELENIIIKNLKLSLNEHNHLVYPAYKDDLKNVKFENNNLIFTIEERYQESTYKCPRTIEIYTFSLPLSDIILEKIENNDYSIGKLKLLKIKAERKLTKLTKYLQGNYWECTMDYQGERSEVLSSYDFEYNFGTKDENFIELQNAIEALKNPGKKYNSSGKQNENAQKPEGTNFNPTPATSPIPIVNTYTPSAKRLNAKKLKEQDSEFDGDWSRFLSRNLNADTLVSKGKQPGKYTATIKFFITADGKVSEITTVSGDPDVAEEAKRVIMLSSGRWIPAQYKWKAIGTYKIQPITMSISEE